MCFAGKKLCSILAAFCFKGKESGILAQLQQKNLQNSWNYCTLYFTTCLNHMFSNSLVLSRRLSLWDDSSHIPVSSRNLLFWDYPGLNNRSLWIFKVDHTFYRLSREILAVSNNIKCVHSSQLLFSTWAAQIVLT